MIIRLTQYLCWSFVIAAAVAFFSSVTAFADEASDFFENRIRPVLVTKCGECHAGKTPEGDFRIESREDLIKGGMSGTSLVSGDPNASALIQRLISDDPDKVMPPEEPLPENVIADFKRWVADGAVWPENMGPMMGEDDKELPWAFHPIQKISPPQVADEGWCRTDIDRFLWSSWSEQGLKPVSFADKRTLLRRVTLDLTGLPPTAEEVDAFLSDESPEAYGKVVDRLLDSPAYGERWGRHWLDLARYADTSGDGTDMPVPEARYYRDYVIAAFNRDMPYDQFITEQLAGDILAKQTPDDPRNYEKIIATGYIALSRRFGNSRNAEYELIIDDTIDTVGRSMLGLTLGCARCHHHKFDPVTANDYYGLFGYFHNTLYPHAGTEHQKERADFVSITIPEELKETYENTEAWAVSDKEKPAGDVPVYVGGDPKKKGDSAPRGFLDVLNADDAVIPEGESGRLQLAQWITSPENPLTPRVIVNRIWQHHFGKGFVATPSNFGQQCAPPSHPELLDWLATEFMSHGWSFKYLHRQILLSAAYQLDSVNSPEQVAIDEANHFFWRFDRQRMDAETLRDSILAVSGTLEAGTGGRHPFPPNDKLNFSQGNPFFATYDHNHRTVYLMSPRLNRHPFMALYDGPDPNNTTAERPTSTVALQALSMMNGDFMKQKATAFAKSAIAAHSETSDRVNWAYQRAYGRPPEATELTEAADYLTAYQAAMQEQGKSKEEAELLSWASFSRVLLSSNEFVYID
ncbi:MAG: PSD1 domain-containing protein [Planctomycetaceae bacterium]|nr:PSD1 domain-containing protein [Planctomycetaceae bacterium]